MTSTVVTPAALLDRPAGAPRRLDHLADGVVAHPLAEHLVTNVVPGPGAWLACRPLRDVDLRPAARLVALPASVLDRGEARVQLPERDEATGVEPRRRRRHVPSPELVHPRGQLSTGRQPDAQPVARAPGIRSQPHLVRLRGDVAANELPVSLKPTGRQDHRRPCRRFGERFSESQLTTGAQQRFGEEARVETKPDGVGIARIVPDDRGAERLEPREVVVEALVDDALERLVAVRAFGAKAVELAVAPNDTARKQHRAARAITLLEHQYGCALLRCVCGGAEPGHAGPGDYEVKRGKSFPCARRTRALRAPVPR